MLHLIIILISICFLFFHAKLTEHKQRFTFLDYCLFIVFAGIGILSLIDLIFKL